MKKQVKLLISVFCALVLGVFAWVPGRNAAPALAASPTPIDVYILAGQSNAAGYSNADAGTYRSELTADDARNVSGYGNVLYYGTVDVSSAAELPSLSLQSVKIGLGRGASFIGPELGMAKALAQKDTPSAIIKYACGGTWLTDFAGRGGDTVGYGNWASPSVTKKLASGSVHANNGLLYNRLLQVTRDGVAALKSAGYAPSIKGFAWMQGEADSASTGYAGIYERALELFIGDLRAAVGEIFDSSVAAARPFVVGKISPSGYYGDRGTALSMIRSAQDAVAARLGGVYTVESEDLLIHDEFGTILGSDDWHFNAADMYTLGKRFGSRLVENSSKFIYTVSAGAGGEAEIASVYSNGEAVSIPFTVLRGKKLGSVTLDGGDITSACTVSGGLVAYTPVGASGEGAIELVFTDAAAYSLTVDAGEGGRVTRSISGSTVYEGDIQTLSVMPYVGYEIDAVTLNGAPLDGENGSYSFEVTGDSDVEVTFKKAVVPADAPTQEAKSNTGLIVGLAVGLPLGLGAVAALVVLLLLKKRKKNAALPRSGDGEEQADSGEETTDPTEERTEDEILEGERGPEE